MSGKQQKVIDKLAKLLTKEQSLRQMGTPEALNEAQALAGKISNMLLENRIEMSDVEFRQAKEEDPFDTSTFGIKEYREAGSKWRAKHTPWLQALGSVVAGANFCKVLLPTATVKVDKKSGKRTVKDAQSSTIYFFGRASDRKVCVYLYGYLVRELEKMSQREYDKEYNKLYDKGLPTWPVSGFKQSWLDGAVAGIASKMAEARKAVIEAHTGSMALVRQSHAETQTAWEESELGQKEEDTEWAQQYSKVQEVNVIAMRKGFEAGKAINTSTGIGGNTQDAPKQLGGK